jgi:glycosyltransferase involved in cell wall biosynthesis
VIAVRDGGSHLADALDSVLGQRPAPLEVVAVDDGSTDGTPAALAAYAPSVRTLRQPPSGHAVALNRGVGETRGALVAFCDADDRWVPGRLGAQLDALAADPDVDMVGGLVEEFLSPDASDLAGRVRVSDAPVRVRLLQALVVRRHTLDRVGRFDESLRHGVAIDWISRADALGARVGWVDTVVVQRRIHHGNMGHDTGPARADLLAVLRRDRQRRVAATGSSPAPDVDR